VIALRRRKIDGQGKHFLGLIFASYCRHIPELSRDRHIQESWRFSNLHGEYSEPPYFLRFDNLYEATSLIASSEQVKQCWHDALVAEVNRAKSSPYKRFHQAKVYKLATDKNLRTEILDMAYPENKPFSR
jgi:5-methylcytosine-specific restriction protein A